MFRTAIRLGTKSGNRLPLTTVRRTVGSVNRDAPAQNPALTARPDNAFFEDVLSGGPSLAMFVDTVHLDGSGFGLSTGMQVEGGVIVTNGEAILWKANPRLLNSGVMQIDRSSLGIFDVLLTKPDMLIIGTGQKNQFVSKDTRDFMHSLGIQVDTMDTKNAASTFNVLASEGRSVALAVLPTRH